MVQCQRYLVRNGNRKSVTNKAGRQKRVLALGVEIGCQGEVGWTPAYLSNIKPHHTLFETTHALEVKEELPALAILGDHVPSECRDVQVHERDSCRSCVRVFVTGHVHKLPATAYTYSLSRDWNANMREITNGCVIFAIIRRSAFVCSIWLRRRTSSFLTTFIAYTVASFVHLGRTKNTLPKEPCPITFTRSKSDTLAPPLTLGGLLSVRVAGRS
mmetsp:Transcript_9361/g.23610  ORF Transcript_9361/g.23610 Transcript_9361/m.23610 type:complete len:215 (+) Transcript_9361:866-1510(+)